MTASEVALSARSELEAVYREHGSRLWRSLLLYSGDPEVASDAMAEAFTQALARGDAIRSPLAWVWKAAFRLAAGELKRSKGRRLMEPHGSSTPDEALSDVLGAMAALSPKQRGSLILHHYAGYPIKDVARILGSTPAAVGVHLHRGRTRLRRILEDDHA